MSFTKILHHIKPRFLELRENDNLHYFWRLYLRKYFSSVQIRYYSKQVYTNNVLYQPDPKVLALQDKFIYSEYLYYEKMKLGFEKRVKIRKKVKRFEEQQRLLQQLQTPTFSVLLNRVSSSPTDSVAEEEREVTNSHNGEPSPIVHMPYASTDNFKVTNESTEKVNVVKEEDMSQLVSLNEGYKALYEKYLETKSLMQGSKKESFIEYENAYKERKLKELEKIPEDWMNDYDQYDDSLEHPSDWLYGTENENENISQIPCGGCGALLHCKDHALPGYLPSELFVDRTNEELKDMVCQRCHFMKNYNTALEVKVSPEDYPELLKVIKTKKCAVILMVDLTDFPCSIWPNIGSILHPRTSIFLVGNKIDLLPRDSSTFEMHVKKCLTKAVESTGIKTENIRHVALISAKTGYGVEELINKLHTLWRYKGDVYMIGCTNVGKSSLFNLLLQSDYCKVQAADLIQRATTSLWPGTTLNLLKFPILNPVRWKLYMRTLRLKAEQEGKKAAAFIKREEFRLSHKIKYATPEGFVGQTFTSLKANEQNFKDPFFSSSHKLDTNKFGLDETHPDFKDSHWCYDTPGTIQSDQILDLLTIEELVKALPRRIITPKTFVMQPKETIFIGGLGRLDYIEGNTFIRCTVFASSNLPIAMCNRIDADDLYKKLLHTAAFVVPTNNTERLKIWPSLEPKQFEITGINEHESAADVVLSSAGWIAITPNENEKVTLQGWTPNARGIYLRTPALLRKTVNLRGARVPFTPAYRKGRQVYIPNKN